ncbi:hypothetical protein JMF97_14060 [Micromonospora fiedleri]|uniref:Calpain catalytic domain-containing protein n=1 Tax=Micromonospora fiedleri TaxID=1157498 RepID=A0ABS1ULQ7_9ACTN|nr:hypothetical protein [Micromonospora fiedleri]
MAVPNPKHSLGEYGWVWDAICWVSAGEAWPSGDEDRMRELADAWQSLADLVGEVLTEADPAVMKILQSWGGGAGEAFGALWNQVGVDPNTGLPLIQEIAAAYASGCDQAALEIEYAKLTVLIAVIITVIAVFVALLMAWLGGVSAGAIPGILAAGRQAVTVAFRRLIAQLGRQLLTRAGLQAALRTAGSRVGQIVTSQGFRQGLNRLGLELMEEIGEELIIDVGAQAYQMRSGERRQWDGNRTLTAGVGGAYGAVLGSGMNWAGRRMAPKMPVSFSPSRLSFPGSGLVRWGGTSIASGAQNALISPAASVLANLSVNQQFVLPGGDAFLGGFASGAGRTGATLAGGATGNLGAKVTNLGLDRLNGTTTPGAGLGAGLNPSPGVGGVDLGNLGNTSTDGGSSGAAGRGSTETDAGTVQNGGGTVPQSGAGSISLAPAPADASVGAPPDGATSTSGPATTTDGVDLASGANDPNSTDVASRGDESGTAGRDDAATTGGRVPTDGTPAAAEPAGDTNRDSTPGDPTTPVADTPADRATSDSTEQAGPAERADSGPPTDQAAAGAPDTATDPTGDRGQSSPVDTTGDRAPGSAADSTGDQAPNSVDTTGERAQSVPVDTSGDRAQSAPVDGTGDRVQSAPVDTSAGNARTVPVDGAQSVPVDVSAGAGRTVGVGAVPDSGVGASVDGPGGPVVSGVDPLAAEIAPAVVPGAPSASPVAGPTPGNVTLATTPNPAQTTAVPSASTPAATPTAPAPTTSTPAPGTPTAGPSTTSTTSTTPATGNTGTQPTPRAPANTTAPNSAGSVSLTPPPSAAPATQPDVASVTPPDAASATQPVAASVAQPDVASATPPDVASTAQPDTGPAVRPTAPAETAGTDSATASASTDPTVTPATQDAATDPAAHRADRADQSATGGPVVVAVPGSTGTLQPGGPTTPDPGRGPVNPDTLRRSEGPTGNGTHSWQLAPTAVDGDPTGPDAERALIEASRTLAETTRRAVKDGTISRAKQPGTSGALLMPDGGITTHTSMTADKGTKPPTQPSVHPLAQAALDRTKAALPDGTGSGHGKCAEVALVSDQLYRLETQWRDAGQPGSFEQYALDAFNGAKILTHQVKPAQQNDIVYKLGHNRPPCRSCAHFLPQFGIEPIVDPERDARTYLPPVPGAVGNGPPLSDNRPYGDPNGLVPPDQADQQALDAAVPRDATTGRPLVHPDPRVGSWAGLVNDGGPTVPGRDNNCADVGLSVLATWFGRPEVAAPTITSAKVEAGSTARQEQALRAEFAHQGTGTAGLDAVADALRAAGPGSAALIITTRPDGNGAHTWNAVNHDGTIIWLDGQNQLISDTEPVHGDPGNVWSIVLDAEGDPHRPAATDTDIRPPAPPDSTAPDDTSATASPYLDGLAEADQATLHETLADAQRDADQILADLHDVNAEVNTRLGLTGADALSTLGEQHRVKGAESLARKFRTEMEPLGYDLGSALDTVNDVVRFSVQGPETEAYGPAVDAVLSSLEAQGYQVTDLKNFWHPGNRFFGLNCTLTSPTGRTFELQFPTATSYAIGKQTHLPYEVMRDPAQSPGTRVHAFLDILAINKANGIAARMPGGMDSARFDTPKNTSFAKWMSSARQESIRQSYLDWLGQQGQTFADVLAARGLTASDLPGLDPDLMGGPHDGADVRLLPPAETGRPDGPAGQPDRGGGEFGADPGGDLGPSDGRVDVPPGRGGGDPVGESGASRDRTGRPGDGGTPGGALHDGAAADGSRTDGDLPPGDLTAAPSLDEGRRFGPGELAPLEDARFHDDLAASLATPHGYAVFADPSTHPYGRLVNDGGPDQPGRGNNCLDSSLSALASFHGDPQVSRPRWPDRLPDGSIDRLSGERGGLERAEAWIGGQWTGGPDGLPTDLSARTEAVAAQYADLYQQVADAGPGASALVVADWLLLDDAGNVVLDHNGQPEVDGSHAFVIVFPADADAPVWWDPQTGTASVNMPTAEVRDTHALWAMMVPDGEGRVDRGRGVDADQPAVGDRESDSASGVRVRLAGPGETLGTGTVGGDGSGAGQLHHRPDGSDHGSLQPASEADHGGVHPGATRGPDQGSAGLAPTGTDGLTDPDGPTNPDSTTADGLTDAADHNGPPAPPGTDSDPTPADGPDLRQAAAGTAFGGALLDTDPARTAQAVQEALTTGPLPEQASVDPAAATVTLDTADGPYQVRIVLADPPAGVPAVPVATVGYTADGAVVQVSTGAHPDHVRRAVSAMLAEVDTVAQERAVDLRTDATTALAEGARPEYDGTRVLTARDIGRLAELRVVLADSAATTDAARAGQLQAEALSLLVTSGLLEQDPAHAVHGLGANVPVVGAEAAQARLDLIRSHLGPVAPAIENLIGQATGQQLVADLRAARSAIRAEARTWAQQATALRNAADLALTTRVDAALDTAPEHVFGRLVIGGGWAATADFVTMGGTADTGDGLPPVLCVSQGHDPWAERQALLMGQIPSELELPGLPFQPADLAEAGTQFTPSDVFADAVGAARALSGMPTYQGTATAITPRPADAVGWPDGANFRVTVGGRQFFTASVDVASGPGPSRVPNAPANAAGQYVDPTTGYRVDRSGPTPVFRAPDGTMVDPDTLPATVRTVLGAGVSNAPLLADFGGRPTNPLVVDPTSGYAVDPTTGQVFDPDGGPVDPGTLSDEVRARLGHAPDGSFGDPRPAAPAVDFGGQNLADAYRPGDRVLVFGAGASGAWDIEQAVASQASSVDWSARAMPPPPDQLTGDPGHDADARLRFSFGGGYNRRNTLPEVGAYADSVRSQVEQSLREIVSLRHTVDGGFLVEFTDGSRQAYDRVVFSIGQAPEYPGGVADLLSEVDLSPLHGPATAHDGPADVLGLRDTSGQLRVLGGASVAGPLLAKVGPALRQTIVDQAAALPDDSRGIPPSIRFHAQRIAEANLGAPPVPPGGQPTGGTGPDTSGVPSDLVPAGDAEQSPTPLDVEPGQRTVPLVEFPAERRHLDSDGPAVDVLPDALGDDLDGVAPHLDVTQGGQVTAGGEGLGTGRPDATVGQAQPPQPTQVRGGGQRGDAVVTDRVVTQVEGDQTPQSGDTGDVRHQPGRVDQGQVADGQVSEDLGTVVDEGAGGHRDQLDESVADLPVDEQVGDRRGEPRDDSSVPQGGGPVGPGARQVDADHLGVVGVGGLDGVGVAPTQVEVVGVGQDGGVQLGGRGHDGSVSTAGSLTASAVPGSTFHGLGRPDADPDAVLDAARGALPQVAPYAQVDAVVPVGPDRFEIRPAGQHPLTVRLTAGPLADGVVAQSVRNPDGTFTVTVSERAVDQAVVRALAHEVAELVALNESGRALVGPLDPGNVRGPIDPSGLTAHDQGRLAEIRLLAAGYPTTDAPGRLAVRAEIDALADHLGLRVGDQGVRARWALLPRDVLAHLMQLSVPALTPEAVSAVLAGAPTLTEVERVRLIDYRSRLAPDFQVPQSTELTARMRELAAEAEHTQSGMPRMPAFAGQIIGIPPAQLDRVRAVDPQLADRLASEGVYVDLTGRYDLRPYMADVPAIDLGAARPAYDLSTEAGRQAQLHEDRQRSRAALRALRGGQAATLLADHDFHYQGTARWMGLVPDVLTDVLRGITPVPPTPPASAESASTQGPSGDTQVVADRVTLPPDSPTTPGPAYGPALDARTGQPAPLFDGPPRREDVQQGALGDCGMIAVIGAVAGHLPDTIAQMFHPNPDGSVDVLLHEASGPGQSVTPTGRQLRVTVWPDVPLHANSNGRSAYADQSTVGSSWASLLEKAIAAVDRTWTEQRHDQWQQQWSGRPGADPHQAAPLGYARLGNGSSRLVQAELLTQLTGLPSSVSRLDPTPGREAEAEARLATLLSAGSPVITGTLPAAQYPGKPPYGLIPGHAYEVVSVTNGEVQLRNPWNASHPTPMPVRAFLDLMSPWYGHVEVAQSSVAALPDSDFHGQGRPAADPTAVLDRARLVLPTLADTIGADQIAAVEPDVFEVRAGGLAPLRVQVTTGALTGTTVAQTIRNLDGTFTLTVSDRAVDAVVDRAVAHELAELLARHESGQAQVGLFDQGTPEAPIDPAGLTARDRGRLAELRVLAAGYPNADPSTRLVLRREIDALVDQLGLPWGTPGASARLALLPADAWHHVIRLSTPKITPEAVAGVLAVNPDPNRVERFRAIDYRARLAPDFQPRSAAELTNKLRELAVHGEQSQSSLPRMPALAGQVVALPPTALDAIRQTDPQLADRLAAEGVYVDLTGRFDLRPYTLDGAPEFPLDVSAPAFDLTTEGGRRSLLAEDRSRVAAAFRAAYGSNPAAMAVLSTHGFHYVTDARLMALVPNALTDVLRAMLPPDPSTIVDIEIEVEPTVIGSEVAVVADRVTLPDPVPNSPVGYGQALDLRTGQPAPLFDGPPQREQVRQGALGDCGMLATMAAVAGHRPDALAQLFQPNPDGTVDVLLHESMLHGGTSTPTGRRLRITVRPDVPLRTHPSGTSAYADRSSNGSGWASVLEKALAAVDRTWTMQRRVAWQQDWTAWHSKNDPHRAAPLGYARLHVGSTSDLQAELMTQLTGAPSRMSRFDTRPGQEAAVAARLAALLAAGSPVIVGTWPKRQYQAGLVELPFGLVFGHAYEVVSVVDGLVHLRNPWNIDHPTPMSVRDFLNLMAPYHAHLDMGGTSSVPQTVSVTSPDVPPTPPTMPLTPSVPAPRSAEPATRAASDRPRRHTLGRTDLEDERADISYLALLDGSGTVIGLSVVLLSSGSGQREARWTTSGESGIGGSVPVGRAEAERIAREVLGFRLPEESALHEMIDG